MEEEVPQIEETKKRDDKTMPGRFAAFSAVVFLIIAAIIDVCLFFGVIVGPRPERDPQTYAFDREWLSKLWNWRRNSFPGILAIGFFNSAGLLLLAYSASLLSRSYKGVPGLGWKLMYASFSVGAIIPAIGFLQNLGALTTARILSNWANLTSNLSSVEISFLLTSSRSVWLESLVYIFVAIGLMLGCILAYASANTAKQVKAHAIFGVIVGFIGFFIFGLDVAQFFFPSLLKPFALCSFFYSGIGLSVWSFWLGINLKHVDLSPQHQYIVFHDDISLDTEVQMEPFPKGEETFISENAEKGMDDSEVAVDVDVQIDN